MLLHQMIMLRGRELSDILKVYTPHLRTTSLVIEIDIIEQQFEELQSTYHCERFLKAVLFACGPHASFDNGWKPIQDKLQHSISWYPSRGKRLLNCQVGKKVF